MRRTAARLLVDAEPVDMPAFDGTFGLLPVGGGGAAGERDDCESYDKCLRAIHGQPFQVCGDVRPRQLLQAGTAVCLRRASRVTAG